MRHRDCHCIDVKRYTVTPKLFVIGVQSNCHLSSCQFKFLWSNDCEASRFFEKWYISEAWSGPLWEHCLLLRQGGLLVFDKAAQECDSNQRYNPEALGSFHSRKTLAFKEDDIIVFSKIMGSFMT